MGRWFYSLIHQHLPLFFLNFSWKFLITNHLISWIVFILMIENARNRTWFVVIRGITFWREFKFICFWFYLSRYHSFKTGILLYYCSELVFFNSTVNIMSRKGITFIAMLNSVILPSPYILYTSLTLFYVLFYACSGHLCIVNYGSTCVS